MKLPTTIAIDGPAGSGKSTLGALLAAELSYLYFDTGVMYRAVTLAALEHGLKIEDEEAIGQLAQQLRIDVQQPSVDDGRDYDVLMNDEDATWKIRSDAVNANVSPVSTYGAVREAMTKQQQRIAKENKVVMVGRDIGTVVVPDADLKIYLDASIEVRAQRRYKELMDRGITADYYEVLKSLKNRDDIDSNREIAPLKIAEDARIIQSDCMSIQDVLDIAKEMVNDV
jgi:cytidylate kinase